MTNTVTTPFDQPLNKSRWQALYVILMAAFMVLLDTSIVTNAVATMQTNLNATYAQIQFVLTAYSVAYGMLLITGGRLGDFYGRKQMFLFGLIAFIISSALCGMAQSATMLIVFRIFQGLSAALLFPQISSFIQVLFPPKERTRAFALQGATVGLGIVFGPLLGGILIDADIVGLSWRPIFLINIPIGLLTLFFAARVLHESKSNQVAQFDVPGVFLVAISMFLLTYPIIQGRDEGWSVYMVMLLVASLPVLAVFLVYQQRISSRGQTPLIELKMFSDPAFAFGSLITFVFQSSVLSYFVVMTIFFQAGLGYTPQSASLILISYQLSIVVGSLTSTRLSARLGRHLLSLGFSMLFIGLVATMLILQASALSYQGYELIPALIISGTGFGWVIAPLSSLILSRVNPAFAGSASGVLSTIQQVGAAIGVALIGMIFFGQLGAAAGRSSQAVIGQLEQNLSNLGVSSFVVPSITQGFQQCFIERSSQSDPSFIPPSCQNTPVNQEVQAVISTAARDATKINFLESTLVALRYHLIVYALCFGLIFLVPNRKNP